VIGALQGLYDLLPSTKDTVSGRASRTRWKAGLVIAGVVFIVGGRESTWFAIPALVLIASAAVLPLSAQGKRQGLLSLRRMRAKEVHTPSPAKLVHDGRRLELWEEDTKLRHVLTDRAFTWTAWRDPRDASTAWWSVRPAHGKKKRDVIWIAVDGAPDSPHSAEELPHEDVVDAARVTHPEWSELRDRLQALAAAASG